jgi:ABC-2 type transport system ATP-binding protein
MLEVKDLTKAYGRFMAVQSVNFTLEPGDIFGFIGSNGAGKTTTIRMLATLLEPTSGTASLHGIDVRDNPMEIRKRIGYMPDFFGLYDDIKVWEYLDFFAHIYRIPANERQNVIDNVLELTDLTIKRDAFVQSLSRGMQQRLCLARCLVHDPDLLLLDEPASGLDPRARAELKELILELGRMGKIVIVSSHILPELATFCNKVGIIERGRMLALGPVDEIVANLRPHRTIEARLASNSDQAATYLRHHPAVLSVRATNPGSVTFDISGNEEEQALVLANLISAGHKVYGFQESKADLEDVFMTLTTGAVN